MLARSFPLPFAASFPYPHWDGDPTAADLFAPCGTPTLAVFDGWAQAQNFSLGGYTVRLTGDDGTAAYYAHLADGGRVTGRVRAGDVIGYVSNSGNANKRADGICHDDEAHVHFAAGQITSGGGGTIDVRQFLAGADVQPVADVPPAVPDPFLPPSTGGNLLLLALLGLVVAVVVWG